MERIRNQNDQTVYFNRYVALLAMAGEPEFIDFLAGARPQVVQMGFYGPQVYGLAETEEGGGYPMRLPVRGIREVLEWQKDFNGKVHELGGKVLGHFSMTIAWGEPSQKTGFLQFYDEFWPPDLLGEKPVGDVRELLHRGPDGEILVGDRYGFPWVAGCSNSPHWREFHKRMVRVAISECGVDGFVSLYNYNHGCACQYCNSAFRTYLSERYSPTEISALFNIGNLEVFRLDGTLAKVPGWINEESPYPAALQIEAMRFAQVSRKRHYDEIFIDTGRRLKPDLILGSWNHLGFMSTAEERNMMPKELWGRGENHFWYSTGGQAGTVTEGNAGVRTLNLKWIWELSGRKLPVLGRYEGTRIRASIAESLANGGPGMGLYCAWSDPAGRKAFVDYLHFAREYEAYYHPVESYAEIALVFPRQSVQIGDDEPLESFRQIGQILLDQHILFDVLSDENLSEERLAQYDAVILPNARALSLEQCTLLAAYVSGGRLLIATGESASKNLEGERLPVSGLTRVFGLGETSKGEKRHPFEDGLLLTLPIVEAPPIVESLRTDLAPGLSEIDTPWMVRVSAFSQPERLLLHLVNYNRQETEEGGPANEKPIAVADIGVNLRLDTADVQVIAVTLLSPDVPQREKLTWEQTGNRVQFQVPSVLVYGVVVIELG
jgi:hypothetical protein